jgi:hypothetical protein
VNPLAGFSDSSEEGESEGEGEEGQGEGKGKGKGKEGEGEGESEEGEGAQTCHSSGCIAASPKRKRASGLFIRAQGLQM